MPEGTRIEETATDGNPIVEEVDFGSDNVEIGC
jgi:hypothetical protein